MAEESTRLAQHELTCIECRCTWLELDERWRVYLTDDDPPEVVAYCPRCARREFRPPVGKDDARTTPPGHPTTEPVRSSPQ